MQSKKKMNHGSAKSLTLNPICRDENYSDSCISKYFKSNKCSKDNGKTFSMDSPYKNIVGNIKLIQPSDDDFKTPKVVKKVPKVISKKKPVSKKKKNSKPSNKIDSIFKRTKDNFKNLDVNPDHLQLALGLSKSTYETENPGVKCPEDDLPTFIYTEKMPRVGTTLEKYGFRKKILGSNLVVRVNQSEVPKKRIYSRFQFVKPTLLTRKDEDRESLIKSKVALLVNNSHSPTPTENNYELFSNTLQKIFVKESKILSINSYEYEEIIDFDYFLNNLKIPRESSSCGCLLKNWSDIPGRDKSPVRCSSDGMQYKLSPAKIDHQHQSSQALHEHHSIILENSSVAHKSLDKYETNDISLDQNRKNISQIKNCNSDVSLHIMEKNTCVSPNLFDSDDETCSPRSESFNTISKVFESESGIEHFEGYDHINQTLCEEVYNSTRHEKKNYYSSTSADPIEIKSVSDNSKIISSKKQAINSDKYLISITLDESDSEETEVEKHLTSISLDNEQDTNLVVGVVKKIVDETKISCMDLQSSEHHKNQNSDDEELPSFTKYSYRSKHFLENNCVIDLSEEMTITSQFVDKDEHCSSFENKINKPDAKVDTEIPSICKQIPEHITDEIREDRCIEPEEIMDEIPFEGEIMDPIPSPESTQCSTNQNTNSYIKQLGDHSLGKTDIEDVDMNMQREMSIYSENEWYEPEPYRSNHLETTERISIPRKSVDSNSTDLNITEYITNMLNSQHSTDDLDLLSDTEKKISDLNELSQTSSQESIVISDEELNYSSLHSNEQKQKYDLSDDDCVFDECKEDINQPDLGFEQALDYQHEENYLDKIEKPVENISKGPGDCDTVDIVSSPRSSADSSSETAANFNRTQLEKLIDTPTNKLIIKTRNITPLPNYDQMESPQLLRELEKFGMKPLKRKRGIMLLKYIYESTHPVMSSGETEKLVVDEEEDNRVIKRRKTIEYKEIPRIHNPGYFVSNDFIESMFQEELIFERKTSSKIKSCRIPLQIAWYNFLSYNADLRENILLYEPLRLEVVNAMLKEQSGCKFHLEDLITFLDRKCITFRTSQSQGRRTKKRF